MATTADHLKGKVSLVTPLHYKLEEGYLWALATSSEIMTKLVWFGKDVEKVSVINQGFGENAVSFYSELGMLGHDALDLYGKIGNCLYSAADGVVSYVNDPLPSGTTYNTNTWGATYVDSEQNGVKFRMFYGHISDSLVKVGQKVRAGELISLLGNTGKYTTGPHCHWEFLELDQNNNVLNLTNGYRGGLKFDMLVEDLVIYRSDDLKKLYDYARDKGSALGYYFGFGGLERFNLAKVKLQVVGATRSQYYNYIIRNLFK